MRSNSENVPKNFLQWELGLGMNFMHGSNLEELTTLQKERCNSLIIFLLILEMFQF